MLSVTGHGARCSIAPSLLHFQVQYTNDCSKAISTGVRDMIKVEWAEFKQYKDATGVSLHYMETNGVYSIFLENGNISVACYINIDYPANADQLDFENNYKSNANIPVVARTALQGAMLVSPAPLEGSSFIAVSVNMCDKTTWYPKD